MRLTKKLATLPVFEMSPTGSLQILKPGDIGFNDLFVDAHGKKQGDVDVQPAADQMADRRNAGRGRRHLHHQVGALHRRPQPQSFVYRRFGIVGQIGRAFQADITVPALRLVVNRTQHIGGGANIGDRQMLVNRGDAVVGLRLECFSAASYSSLSPIAFSKIEGFE